MIFYGSMRLANISAQTLADWLRCTQAAAAISCLTTEQLS